MLACSAIPVIEVADSSESVENVTDRGLCSAALQGGNLCGLGGWKKRDAGLKPGATQQGGVRRCVGKQSLASEEASYMFDHFGRVKSSP